MFKDSLEITNREHYKNESLMQSGSLITRSRATYVLNITQTDYDHNFTCTVNTSLVPNGLSESQTVYTYVAPSILEVKDESFRENQTSRIKCITKGGRPTLSHTLIMKNITHKLTTDKFEKNSRVYTVDSSSPETVFSRYNNSESVKCCVDVLGTEICGNWSEINVTFPAVTIHLAEVSKHSQMNGETQLKLNCTAGAANPKSRIEWTGVEDKTLTTTQPIYYIDLKTSGLSTSVMMSFNLTRKHNGRNIECLAVNDEFTNHTLSSIYIVNITYEPLITIIPGRENRTVYVGDNVHLICEVDSNPKSNIEWLNNGHILNATTENRLDLLFPNISNDDAATYSCVANYNNTLYNKDVTLIVEERSLKPAADVDKDTQEKSLIGPVIGGAVGFVVVVIALCVICHRKRLRSKNQREAKPDDKTPQQASSGERKRDSQQCNTAEVNSPVDASKKIEEEKPEYASVAPKGTRINQKNNSAKPQQEKSKSTGNELVYAELDLQTKPTVKQVEIQQEATEYVGIDFAKTGTVKAEDFVEYGNI